MVEELGLGVDELADNSDLGVLGHILVLQRVLVEVGTEEDVERAHQNDQHTHGDDLGDGFEQKALEEEVLEALGQVGVEVEVLPDVAVEVFW